MKQVSCNIIQDLLPLYHDDICSKESHQLVEDHLESCIECKKELQKISKEINGGKEMTLQNQKEANIIKRVSAAWKKDKKRAFRKGVFFISVLACIFCIIAYKVSGSYVTDDGILVESFGYIPLAWLFGLTSFISGITLAVSARRKKIK